MKSQILTLTTLPVFQVMRTVGFGSCCWWFEQLFPHYLGRFLKVLKTFTNTEQWVKVRWCPARPWLLSLPFQARNKWFRRCFPSQDFRQPPKLIFCFFVFALYLLYVCVCVCVCMCPMGTNHHRMCYIGTVCPVVPGCSCETSHSFLALLFQKRGHKWKGHFLAFVVFLCV